MDGECHNQSSICLTVPSLCWWSQYLTSVALATTVAEVSAGDLWLAITIIITITCYYSIVNGRNIRWSFSDMPHKLQSCLLVSNRVINTLQEHIKEDILESRALTWELWTATFHGHKMNCLVVQCMAQVKVIKYL